MALLLPFLVVAHVAHEAFHAIVARLLGLTDTRWRLGFGPVRQERPGLQVGRVPVGLFFDFDHAPFQAAPHWKRTVVVLGGPALSWLASFLVLLGWLWGLPTGAEPAVVDNLARGSAAEAAGLAPGDRITRFGERPVANFGELRAAVDGHAGGAVALTYERAGASLTANVELPSGARLGVLPPSAGISVVPAALAGTLLYPLHFLAGFGHPALPDHGLAWQVVLAWATASLLFALIPLLPLPGFDGWRVARRR